MLVESFNRGPRMRLEVDKVRELHIYLLGSSDMPAIHACAKEMAAGFPYIGGLNFYLECRCEIVSS
jgi:hypothetical protein